MKKLLILIMFICILTGCKKEEQKNKDNKEQEQEISFKMPEKYEKRPINDIKETITISKDITLTEPGTYLLTGTSKDITITIDTKDTIELILSNLNITNTSKEVIKINKAKEVLITLKDKNKLITDEADTIKSTELINIGGEGSLTIESNDSGINSKKDIIIENGTIKINSKKDSIKSDKSIYIFNTNLKINTKRDGIQSEGAILIQNGIFDITSFEKIEKEDEESRKGIKTEKLLLIENGEFNINSLDDPLSSNWDLTINNGLYSLSTNDDAIRADNDLIINNGNINIKKCNEGIESTRIFINNGDIKIKSNDDGINAKAATKEAEKAEKERKLEKILIEINNGKIDIDSKGDAVDSNGELHLNGGELIINTLNEKYNEGSLYTTGYTIYNGTKISGTGNISNKYKTIDQSVILLIFTNKQKKGSTLYLKDSKGNTINKVKTTNDYYYVIFTSKDIKYGEKYNIYINNKKIVEAKPTKSLMIIDDNGKRINR